MTCRWTSSTSPDLPGARRCQPLDHGTVNSLAQVSTHPTRRLRSWQAVERLAARQAGIVSRRQLKQLGITRGEIRAHLDAQRWARVGTQSISTHRGPLSQRAQHWAAVFEAGPRAHLDGASALVEAGLADFRVDRIRVSVPRGARVRRGRGLDIRQTRRWRRDDLVSSGVPRTRVEVAAVRAALWARSNREAAFVLTLVVQRGLTDVAELGRAMLAVRRDKRREFIHGVLLDLDGGVRSIGELDVARQCRERGLPEPSRQVLRRGRNGTYYLDIYWDRWKLVVEVDGIQHILGPNVVGDAIRQNDLAIQGLTVLRLPLIGLRVAADEFFGQVEDALVAAGCTIPGRRTA